MRKDNRLSTDDVLARMAEHNTKALLTAQDKEKAALKMETVAKKMTDESFHFMEKLRCKISFDILRRRRFEEMVRSFLSLN